MFYDIVQVIPNEDYTVYVYFEDGKIVCYDAKPLLDKKVFAPLKNIDFFMNACTILNDTLAWDVSGDRDCSKCLDIDPDMLYSLENVEEKIAYIREIISRDNEVSFIKVIENVDKDEVIATFLSVLELIKSREIVVYQDLFFDDILIKKNLES